MKKRAFLLLTLLLGLCAMRALAEDCTHEMVWQSNESGCWQACSLCGETRSQTPHREFCPGDGACDDCGYVSASMTVYHAYNVYAGHDDATHALACAGCGDIIKQTHYGDCDDTGCALADCGYDKALDDAVHTVTHDFKTSYESDEEQHFKPCLRCGARHDEGAHNFQFSHVITGTCQEAGYEVYMCVCGAEKHENFAQLGTHKYTVTETPAACEETGSRVMVCDYCGETLVDTYPALNHAWDNYDRDLPTCTQSGMTYYQCDLCGDYLEEPLPPLMHDYAPVVVGDETLSACRQCGQLDAQSDSGVYQLVYRVKPNRYGDVTLRMSDGWTEADYAACKLTLIYDDGVTAEAAFTLRDNEVLFTAESACTAAFIRP